MKGFARWVVAQSILVVISLTLASNAKVDGKKFAVHVIKVQRPDDGCTAEVRSDTILYHVSSAATGACAFLRAGEVYKAFLFSGHKQGTNPDDHSEDKVFLVIEDNKEEGKTSAFDIASEEVERKKLR